MRWLCTRSLSVAITLGAVLACSTGKPDCGCLVQQGAERRSIACGQSACVAGRLESCSETAEIFERGACTSPSPKPEAADAGTTPDEPSRPADDGCLELSNYCSSSCRAPAATAADCLATANAGNGDACRQWSLASAVLCRP
jgi:hypothetical protein